MKIKLGILAATLLVVSGFTYSYSSGKSEEMLCHIPVVAMVGQDQNQNPAPGQGGQPGDTPTHRFSPGDGCSSMNSNAPDKERDGVNPNTVGCKCVKKCTNGHTQEDMTKDEKGVYICKNACHKDRCSCPDPCKS